MENGQKKGSETSVVKRQRWKLLKNLTLLTDRFLVFLSLSWLVLLIADFVWRLPPAAEKLAYGIWIIFILNFLAEFAIAPSKRKYLASHWISAVSLFLPAFRTLGVFRTMRFVRTARGMRSLGLLRTLGSMNKGLAAVRRTMRRRGIGFLLLLTAAVTLAGAAAMTSCESTQALARAGIHGTGLEDFWDALWWTAMIMTTMGSEYWPKTSEGRVLAWFLAVYAVTVFGYITATIASHFIGVDSAEKGSPARPE